jgi:hypothetical protein
MKRAGLRFLIVFIFTFVFSLACGSKEGEKVKGKEKAGEKSGRAEITAELYCNMLHEMVTIGVERYYDSLVDREYKDVKEIYLRYRNEREALYEKYNVEEADVNSFRSSFSQEIMDYLKEHPELKWNDTPEKQKFNMTYTELTWAWVEEELKKRRGK